MKLTKKAVENAPTPDKGPAFLWDDQLPGFGLRITATGARSYIVQARVNGKTRRLTLGRHGVLTADEARSRAKSELGRMSDGVDPTAVKQAAKRQEKKDKVLAVTLREIKDQYLRDRRDLKETTREDIRRHVEDNFTEWTDQPAANITRDAVLRKFREFSDRSPAQANQGFRILRALLNFARAQYRTPDDKPTIPENPVNVISEAKMWNRIKSRNNYVPLESVGKWWSHVQAMRTDPSLTTASRTAADLVAFLALTGLRKGEARSLTWDQVDLKDGSMKLHDTKNRTDITLPLSEAALAILREREGVHYVFPSRSGNTHLNDVRGALAKLADATDIDVTPHDIRRTFRAVAGKCGIELWRCKALMNHKQNHDVTLANYTDLEDVRYLRPDANTIGKWFEEQRQIAEAENVVPMEARA